MKLTEENINDIPNKFFVTYFANKHNKYITRKGQWFKPDTDKESKAFVSKNGILCFVYWDLDADGWRMATNEIVMRSI